MDLTLLPKRHQACFRCRSYDLVSDAKAGDVVCRGRGEIQRDRIIDMTDEVRAYDDDSNKKRESRTSGRAEGGLRPSKTVFVGGSSSVAGSYCTSLNRIAEKTEQTEDRMAGILAGQIEKICNVLNLSPHLVVSIA
jgi:transcription initiation factor TFIIIB Brf1 subunit/transcription initiation factor TFIIB